MDQEFYPSKEKKRNAKVKVLKVSRDEWNTEEFLDKIHWLEQQNEHLRDAEDNLTRENETLVDSMISLEQRLNEEIVGLRLLNDELSVKERNASSELRDVHEALINVLDKFPRTGGVGVKRMGRLDYKPFHKEMRIKYGEDEAYDRASDLYLLWVDYLRDPKWEPFKIVSSDEKNFTYVVDKDDEKLKGLREDYGEDVWKAVVKALEEICEYNPSERCVVPSLWNYENGERAKAKEGVEALSKLLNEQKISC